MAFEIEEIEVEEYDPIGLMFKVVDALKKANPKLNYACSQYLADKKKQREYDEFWSDICWTTPL